MLILIMALLGGNMVKSERELFVRIYNFFYINDFVDSQVSFSVEYCNREKNYTSALINRKAYRPSLSVISVLRRKLAERADLLAMSKHPKAKAMTSECVELADECLRTLLAEQVSNQPRVRNHNHVELAALS